MDAPRRVSASVGAGDIIRVGVATPYGAETMAALRAVSPALEIRSITGFDQAAIDAVAADDLDALIATRLPSDLHAVPSLRWLQVISAGLDHLLAGGSWPERITLTNARGAYAGAMAQFAMSAILRTLEPLAERQAMQRDARWPGSLDPFLSRRLRGHTLVLVGYGGIGREVARLADAFGMRVIAVKARAEQRADDVFHLPGTGDPEGRIPERIVGHDALAAAAAEADYLLITLPLTERSRGLVGASVVAALPDGAWVLNIGRGGVLDEKALIGALERGRLGGAVLDVFEEEPLAGDSPLWHLPNVTITPHVAGWGAEPEMRALLSENLRRFSRGEPLLNRVDPARGY